MLKTGDFKVGDIASLGAINSKAAKNKLVIN